MWQYTKDEIGNSCIMEGGIEGIVQEDTIVTIQKFHTCPEKAEAERKYLYETIKDIEFTIEPVYAGYTPVMVVGYLIVGKLKTPVCRPKELSGL